VRIIPAGGSVGFSGREGGYPCTEGKDINVR
jgi:hypothetical protein